MTENQHKRNEKILMFLTAIFAFSTVYQTFDTLLSTKLWMYFVVVTIFYKMYYNRYKDQQKSNDDNDLQKSKGLSPQKNNPLKVKCSQKGFFFFFLFFSRRWLRRAPSLYSKSQTHPWWVVSSFFLAGNRYLNTIM